MILQSSLLEIMEETIEDVTSLGLESLDVLGFQSEEELFNALQPLMEEHKNSCIT